MSDHVNYLNAKSGWKSWLFTLDHKRIGVMYLAATIFAFFLGGIFAMAIRWELMDPGLTQDGKPDYVMEQDGTTPILRKTKDGKEVPVVKGKVLQYVNETLLTVGDEKQTASTLYNKLFTLHGAIMVFLFIIPAIPGVLGNFVLPLMLGAKDVAFPKLNLLSFHLWIVGAIFFVTALVCGGIDTGWTFYAPYSFQSNTAVGLSVIGAFVLGFSSIFTGMNFITTIHAMRPPSMSWFRMPLFLWAMYATACIQILATPVLGVTLALLGFEKLYGVGIFDPALGGDAVLFEHFFWFYSHPAVYIMILPGMGIMSELISTFSRKPIFGYSFVAYSSMAIAAVSFIVWGHHMFVAGQSEYATLTFSLLTFLVGIPSAIKVFNWVGTLYKGSISFETPMCYALAFIGLFTIGGLTGLICATLSTDIHLHDTYYIVAHFHYTMMGGTVIAFLGGIHYWWPKMFGKMYNETCGKVAAVLVFIFFNLTFIPQFLLGHMGMPRRYHNYLPHFENLHELSSLGAFSLGMTFLFMLCYLVHSLKNGKEAPDNPWGGTTVEWQTATPPVEHNFVGVPEIPEEPYVYNVEDAKRAH